jgi:hypothetical protein
MNKIIAAKTITEDVKNSPVRSGDIFYLSYFKG